MKKKKKPEVIKHFFLGIVLLLVVQTIFMLGGLLIENAMEIPITGIPSAIGLTLVLIICLAMVKKSEYILLGSFMIAFVSPLILGVIVLFNAKKFLVPHMYYSITYMVAMIAIVWIYYVIKIFKEGF